MCTVYRNENISAKIPIPHLYHDVEFVQAVEHVREGEARPRSGRNGRRDQHASGAACEVLAPNVQEGVATCRRIFV